ncbi:MAG: ImmA/IrrE family metallo-endopeptidase [Cyclobacteriaceae bacterium]|jgi:Zn-dependent peptidase ImmA (M78 family)/DNA-binding XRE family transcriptional regulator
MLILARESRGISQSELAARIGISQGKLSKSEKGEQGLPKEAFELICQTLDYPETFFFQKTPTSPVSHYYYRKRVTIPQKVMVQIEAVVKILRQNIDSLIEAVDLPEFKLQAFDPESSSPEEIARKTRYLLNIEKGPVPSLVNLLENNGIMIVKTDLFNEKIDGLSTISDKGIHIIFLNERMPNDRQRFSLAHELGHILMHFDIPTISENVEEEANRFASEFLMPQEEIVNSLRQLTFAKLGELKRYWKVSMKALVKRAKDLKTINDKQYRNFQINFSKKEMSKSEPIPLSEESPYILNEVVKLHLNELGYSPGELANVINLNPQEFEHRFLVTERPRLRVLRNTA